METALLSISNLNIDYGQKNILKNINLNVNKGEILGIVGESGSGKSTLIKTIMRLNDKHFNISKGCMLYKGENILTKSNEELRKLRGPEIGMIFQNCGASLCPIRNIGDQIYESVSQHKKISKKEVLKLAIDVFDKINCHCKVIGKVIKTCTQEEDSISLLRKTGQENFYEKFFEKAKPLLECLEENDFFVPECPDLRVNECAIQLMPINIYM